MLECLRQAVSKRKSLPGSPLSCRSRKDFALLNHCRSFVSRVIAAMAAFIFLFAATVYAANPVPTVTAPVHPQAIVPGSSTFTLTVYGANFVSGAVVNWNGSPRSTTFVSTGKLQAKILASDVVKNTAGYITVTNPAPGGGVSSSSFAIVEVHKPTKTVVPTLREYDSLNGEVIEYATTADFNGNGKLDLLGGGGIGNVYLFSGKGDGSFSQRTVGHKYYNGCGTNTGTLGVGDFNNDNRLDYVFAAGRFPNPVKTVVRLSNGNGTFGTSSRFGKYNSCPDFAVGDFNGDGNIDLAFAVGADSTVYIFLGNGDGTFQSGSNVQPRWCFQPTCRGL